MKILTSSIVTIKDPFFGEVKLTMQMISPHCDEWGEPNSNHDDQVCLRVAARDEIGWISAVSVLEGSSEENGLTYVQETIAKTIERLRGLATSRMALVQQLHYLVKEPTSDVTHPGVPGPPSLRGPISRVITIQESNS